MAPVYAPRSLEGLRRSGVWFIDAFCLGRLPADPHAGRPAGRPCTHRLRWPIDELVAKHGPGTALVTLARKVGRCPSCGHRGAHLEPADPPAQGTPGWRDWYERRREALRDELADIERRLA